MPVQLFATLDTKGPEAAYLRDRLQELGVPVTLVDCGCQGEPTVPPDVDRATLFAAAGESLAELQAAGDRGRAVRAAAAGAAALALAAHRSGRLDGVLGLGGSAGSTIGSAAMRALPPGVPKLLVSTLASGQVRPYVGDKDLLLLNSIVDLAGLNRISRPILSSAAAAMAGLVKFRRIDDPTHDRPLVAATMFGVTTPCVQRARAVLEAAGYEVLVFHATGNGGQAMEALIDDGLIVGVLDVTTTELADELAGGVLSAGPDRLTAAARRGVPQVVSVGALDMVNFGPPETVPERFANRRFYRHNPTVTLMRTTSAENARLGAEVARKTAASTGPAALLMPLQGVSAIDRAGQPFDDPEARRALLEGLRAHRGGVPLLELDLHINDEAFAVAAAEKLLELIGRPAGSSSPR